LIRKQRAHETSQTQVVKQAARAVLITGTPLMSKPIEMW
jgi:hypothetical protein